MTTVNKTWNRLSTVTLSDKDNRLYNFFVGTYYQRKSTGGDRPPGQRPGYIAYLQSINTKPLIKHGRVVVPSRSYVVRKYKPDPNYQPYAENHPYTAEFWRCTAGSGLVTHYFSSHVNCGNAYNFMGTIHSTPDSFTAADQLRNLGKLREAIAGSSFNAAVALGEAPRTLKMVSNTVSKVYLAYKRVRSGDPVGAARALIGKEKLKVSPLPHKGSSVKKYQVWSDDRPQKTTLVASKEAAASNWLELQYGWKPLLSDIYDGMVFVDHQLRNPTVHRVAVTSYAGGSKAGKRLWLGIDTGPTHAWILHRQVSSERIIAFLKEKDVIRLSGLLDPASVAWELLPYSFVIDWFIPIGNYLQAKALANSLTGTFVTTRFMRIISVPGTTPSLATNWSMDTKLNYSGTNQSSYVKITRTVSTTLNVPKPEIKPLSKVASWMHTANAVALLTNLKR